MRTTLGISIALIGQMASYATAETKLTVGASAGLFHNKQDAQDGLDSQQTLGLWGRIGLTRRLSGQLELTRHEAQYGCATCTFGTSTDVRVISGVVVIDLADGGRWVPTLLAGFGIDRDDGSLPSRGTHIEGGFGLEYRAAGGLTIGADARMGGRSLDDEVTIQAGRPGAIEFVGPTTMRAGEYRALRVTAGVRF